MAASSRVGRTLDTLHSAITKRARLLQCAALPAALLTNWHRYLLDPLCDCITAATDLHVTMCAQSGEALAASQLRCVVSPLSQVQCTPPLCSARCKQAHRTSPDFRKCCRLSQQAFSAAAVVLPREWVFELYLGKLCAFKSH